MKPYDYRDVYTYPLGGRILLTVSRGTVTYD